MSEFADLMAARKRAVAQIAEVLVVKDAHGVPRTIKMLSEKPNAFVATSDLLYLVEESARLYDVEVMAEWKRIYMPETWTPKPRALWKRLLGGIWQYIWTFFACTGVSTIAAYAP